MLFKTYRKLADPESSLVITSKLCVVPEDFEYVHRSYRLKFSKVDVLLPAAGVTREVLSELLITVRHYFASSSGGVLDLSDNEIPDICASLCLRLTLALSPALVCLSGNSLSPGSMAHLFDCCRLVNPEVKFAETGCGLLIKREARSLLVGPRSSGISVLVDSLSLNYDSLRAFAPPELLNELKETFLSCYRFDTKPHQLYIPISFTYLSTTRGLFRSCGLDLLLSDSGYIVCSIDNSSSSKFRVGDIITAIDGVDLNSSNVTDSRKLLKRASQKSNSLARVWREYPSNPFMGSFISVSEYSSSRPRLST